MSIKKKLEEMLRSVERSLDLPNNSDVRATLTLAKVNILLGLQKYEN